MKKSLLTLATFLPYCSNLLKNYKISGTLLMLFFLNSISGFSQADGDIRTKYNTSGQSITGTNGVYERYNVSTGLWTSTPMIPTQVGAWVATTSYSSTSSAPSLVNNGGSVYVCTTGGTSASSGGPTGTTTGITDGTAVWSYIGPILTSNNTFTIRDGVTQTCGGTVTFNCKVVVGEGNAATATANLTGTSVSSITVNNQGYLPVVPTVTFIGAGTTAATAIASCKLSGYEITNPGTGYSTANVTIGTIWAANTYSVNTQVNNGGNLYTCTTAGTSSGGPTGTGTGITDGGTAVWSYAGIAATATATITSGTISALTITNAGSGYISMPALSITGTGGSGATATLRIGVLAVNVTSGGSYLIVPKVALGTAFSVGNAGTSRNIVINNDLQFKSGATSYTGNGTAAITSTITLSGNLIVDGNINFISVYPGAFPTSQTNITFNGATPQISGAGSAAFNKITVGATTTLAVSAPITVASTVSLNTTGLLTTNGNLTLASTSTGTGSILTGASGGGYISGNVTVQRYIGNSTQWRMVGFPFTAATTISKTTLAAFYPSGYNAYTYNEAADDGSYGNSGTANAGWTAFTSGSVTSNKGILLIGGTPSSTINFTGPLNTGTQTVALSYSGSGKGWNLVANPFPSNINWTTIIANASNASGLNNAIYRYDPNTSQAYASYVNGVSIGNQSNVIENGASFFVQSTGATTLSILETDKVSTAPAATLFGIEPVLVQSKSIIKLALLKEGETYGDEAVVRWGVDPATDGFDGKYDAYDLGRTVGADLSVIGKDGTIYSIFHGSALQTKDKEQREILLGTKNMTEGNYSMNTSLLSDMYDGNEVYLVDHYTNQTTLISASSASYPFIVTSNQASASASRFSIALNYKAKMDIANNAIVLMNNPSATNNFSLVSGSDFQKLTWQLVDNSGRILQSGAFNGVTKGSVNTTATQNLSSGMYFIKLIGDGKVLQTQKLIKQ